MSTTAGCLVASLVVTCGLLVAGFINSQRGFGGFSSTLVAALIFYLFTFVVVVCLAIPFRYFAKRWHFARGWMVVAIGACVGFGFVAAFQYALNHIPALANDRHPPLLWFYLEMAAVGALGGGAFWACSSQEMRPNNSLERTLEG